MATQPSFNYKRCPGDSPACLGMVDFNCCGTANPEDAHASDSEDFVTENSKQKKLPLKSSKKAKLPSSPSTRFNATVSEEEIAKTSKGFVPVNTARSTGWALKTYQTWASQRNQHYKDQCPVDLFNKPHPPDISCNVLQKFVTKKRMDLLILPRPCTSFFVGCYGTPVACRKIHQIFLTGRMYSSRNCMELATMCSEICMKMELAQLKNLLKSSQRKTKINCGRQVLSMSLPKKDYKRCVFLCWESVLLERRRRAEKFKSLSI